MRDFLVGARKRWSARLKKARAEVTAEIRERAGALRADAVVGVNFEISMPSGRGGMLVVFATGTAVRLN